MAVPFDVASDPVRRSWVPGADDSGFPVQHLPYGVIRPVGQQARLGVRIGRQVLDLAVLAEAGLLDVASDVAALVHADSLGPLLQRDRTTWRVLRRRVWELLVRDGDRALRDSPVVADALVPVDAVEISLPVAPGDYVDFYASEAHATAVGRMFRPDQEPLPGSWRSLPIGYHGRASTIVVSGTPVVRPRGQHTHGAETTPRFGPTGKLDFELEVGVILGGAANPLGTPIPIDEIGERLFGVVLVNDWSARDIQAFEYRPLGPMLGKSFATTIAAWVTPMEALAPYRVPGPPQQPPPLPHLRTGQPWGLDLDLSVELTPADGGPLELSRTGFADMYWTFAQQIAHAASNGTCLRPGDLYASGTVSGWSPGSEGCLLERSRDGTRPVSVGGGATRTYLDDGDTVTLRGWARREGYPSLSLGTCRGTILPAGQPSGA